MRVMITGTKDPISVASFWYKDHIGEVFEVTEDPIYNEYFLTVNPIHKKHQGHIKKIDCIEVWDVLPQAIETTASPSKAAADKGVLTEEELKGIIGFVEYDIEEGRHIFWGHAKLLLEEIARLKELELSYLSANAVLTERCRLLVLENDEQLAVEIKLKNALVRIRGHLVDVGNPEKFVFLNCPGLISIINSVLEETK